MIYAIFFRAILSRVSEPDESTLYGILFTVTEPVVAPVRALLARFNFLQDLPLDFSPMIAMVILTFTTALLPAL